MSTRSAELYILNELSQKINNAIADNFDLFAGAVSPHFVAEQTVKNIKSRKGESAYSMASRILEAVKCFITFQPSQERITQKFDKFVLLVHSLGLDDLARLLVENLRKYVCIIL